METLPILSITIPAYNRPHWLKRALLSITRDNLNFCQEIEIIVTDDSSNSASGEIVQEVLNNWPGKWQYKVNNPRLGMAQNWNHGIELASGEYVLILHDDDYLVTGAIANILKIIKDTIKKYQVLLFGVHIVNENEKILKKQTFKKQQYLEPKQALIKLLSNSSFVRFPAIVMQKRVFQEVGYFDPQWGEPTDIDRWIQLFSCYGVYCIPVVTCAYTVHSQALTMGVFNENTVIILLECFERVAKLNILSPSKLRDCQTKFFHQFILAGAFRMLRRRRFKEFHQVMQLFELPTIKDLKSPIKSLIFRVGFGVFDQLCYLIKK